MLLIPYYTTVFRGQSQNRWYKTAMSAVMLLNNILYLLATCFLYFLFGDVKATYPVRQSLKDHNLHSLL